MTASDPLPLIEKADAEQIGYRAIGSGGASVLTQGLGPDDRHSGCGRGQKISRDEGFCKFSKR